VTRESFLQRFRDPRLTALGDERAPLGRDQLVQAAFDLLDQVGLEGLTMRALADRLGVTAASLYWHVRRKEELLELMHEAISAEVPEPDPRGSWREQVEELAWGWRRALLGHRDGARLTMGRVVFGPATLRRMERLLALLRQGGLRAQDVADAGLVLSNFVPGFVAEEQAAGDVPGGGGQTAQRGRARADFAASLGGVGRGILEIKAAEVRIEVEPTLAELYRAQLGGKGPEVRMQDGAALIRLRDGRGGAGVLALNGSIPWEVRLLGGSWRVTADLRQAHLSSLEVRGGASSIELVLPEPVGTVPIRCRGGSQGVTLRRPAGVPMRANVRGGVSNLSLDGSRFDAIGRQFRWETPGYEDHVDRYEFDVAGGVDGLTIDVSLDGGAAEALPQGGLEELRGRFQALPKDEYPNLVGLAGELSYADVEARFGFGLQVVLDGIENRLPGGARPGRGR